MGRILVVYSTRVDETKGIAELIAEGIRQAGHGSGGKKGQADRQ